MAQSLIFVSAGDPSGDNATARLLTELKQIKPLVATFGLGGERLKALGQEQLADGSDLAVIGFWEVVKKYRYFRNLMLRSVREIESRKPSCILLVDYPGFNLRLAERVKHLNIPIIYYISPQVWAWGGKRVRQIAELVDLMMVILPFEQEFYRPTGVRAEFVGHYLLEDIPPTYISSPIPGSNQIALLPGSRPQEIERMLQPMCAAAAEYNRRHGSRAVIAGLKARYDYSPVLERYHDAGISLSYDDSRRVIYESDLAVTASGTATLETGIIGRPMVIVYRTGFITYHIARRLVKIDRIGLVNLVLGEKVVPELIQDEASPRAIVTELEKYHVDQAYRSRVKESLDTVPKKLAAPKTSKRAAELMVPYL
jgi:lipid-A-disaccharide synthase